MKTQPKSSRLHWTCQMDLHTGRFFSSSTRNRPTSVAVPSMVRTRSASSSRVSLLLALSLEKNKKNWEFIEMEGKKNNKFYFYDCKFMPYVAAWRWKFWIFNVFSFHKHGYFFHFFKVFRLTLKPRSWISWITWSFTFCAYHISYPHPSKVVFRLAAPETSLTSVSSTLFTYNFARV